MARAAQVGGVQEHAEADQRVAGADDGGAGVRREGLGAEVGAPAGLLDLFGEALVLALADVVDIAAGRIARGLAEQVHRDLEARGHLFGELHGHLDGLGDGGVLQGDERKDVHRADAGVGALVPPHVDPCQRHLIELQAGFEDGVARAGESEDRPVADVVHGHVQHHQVGHAVEPSGQLVDELPVTALADVGDHGDDLAHGRLLEDAEENAGGDGRSDDAGDVGAHGVHQQVVVRIFGKTHQLGHAGRVGDGRHSG